MSCESQVMYGAYGVSDGVLSDPGPGMMLPEEPLEGPEDLSLMPKTWSDIDLDEIEQVMARFVCADECA